MTPGFHRVHHVPRTAERNLGTVLTVWDALRGTLVRAQPAADVELGVPLETSSYPQDWLRQLVEPYFAIRTRRRGVKPSRHGLGIAYAQPVSVTLPSQP